jgi:hypothetical protein
MDQIPARFYPFIIKELRDAHPTLSIPAVLSRAFLDLYGCTGSYLNPLVCPVLSSDTMISYRNVFFTGGGKALCFPLLNLVGQSGRSGSQLYLNKDSMFRPIATFIRDNDGIRLDPVYLKKERCHEYWDITLSFEHRDNVDIIKFVIGSNITTLIYIKDDKQCIAVPDSDSDLPLYEFRQQLRQLNEPKAHQLDTEISLLNERELHYLSVIIQDDTLSCPYRYFRQLSDRCNEAMNYMDDIITKFNMVLTFPIRTSGLDEESQLLRLAKQMEYFNRYQIVNIIGLGYWTLFEYILRHPKFTRTLRKEVVSILLKEQLVANIPEKLILELYNWRCTATTNEWVNALTNVGRYQTAAVVSTAPFAPSRLRLVHCCKTPMILD